MDGVRPPGRLADDGSGQPPSRNSIRTPSAAREGRMATEGKGARQHQHQHQARRNGAQAEASVRSKPNAMGAKALPPCRLLLRSRDGVEVFTVPSERSPEEGSGSGSGSGPVTGTGIGTAGSSDRVFLFEGPTSFQVLHPDGNCCFVKSETGVFKLDLEIETGPKQGPESAQPFLAGSGRVQVMEISPNGSYLLTWERPLAGEEPNLKVWSSETGECLAGFRLKALRRESWPHVQWTSDESLAFLLCTNEVRVYHGHFKAGEEVRYVDKIYISGIASLSVGPSSSRVLFVSFSPNDSKGNKPSQACLYDYTAQANAIKASIDSEVKTEQNEDQDEKRTHPIAPVMFKAMFAADELKVHWNPRGDSALIALQSSVDVSGQSYYGSTVVYLMSSPLPSAQSDQDDKGKQLHPIEVPLPQDGPVLDVAWMPNPVAKPQCFIVVAGRMPSMASLHNGITGKPTFVFGNAHRNTVAWAPHGRFVCIAGFGNLAGGMTFWDRNKLKQIPPARPITASCTVGYGWSPDSRLFFSSTTSPRMNVDNGLKLFRYNGDEVDGVPWNNSNYLPNKLLQASFIPKRTEMYPDRPQSPSLRETQVSDNPSGAPADVLAPPPGRYIPPSARNRTSGDGTSLADRMRAEKEGGMRGAQKVSGNDRRRGVVNGGPNLYKGNNSNQRSVPGLAPTSEGPSDKNKNVPRRGKQKKSDEKWVKMSLEESLLAKEKAKKEAADAKIAAEEEGKIEPDVDPVKRERKIKKILKQIDDLKLRGLSALDDDQMRKVQQEPELLKELNDLHALIGED